MDGKKSLNLANLWYSVNVKTIQKKLVNKEDCYRQNRQRFFDDSLLRLNQLGSMLNFCTWDAQKIIMDSQKYWSWNNNYFNSSFNDHNMGAQEAQFLKAGLDSRFTFSQNSSPKVVWKDRKTKSSRLMIQNK